MPTGPRFRAASWASSAFMPAVKADIAAGDIAAGGSAEAPPRRFIGSDWGPLSAC